MNTTTASQPSSPHGIAVAPPSNTTSKVVMTAGLVGALGSAAYIAGVIFVAHGKSDPDLQSSARTVSECLTVGVAYILIAVHLRELSETTRLPRWALTGAAAGCALIAVQAWAFGSVVAHLADQLPAAEYDSLGDHPTYMFQLMFLPMGAVVLGFFTALAVTGWRRRAIPRGACVLLVIAGVASLMGPFPPVGFLGGLALAWTARSAVGRAS